LDNRFLTLICFLFFLQYWGLNLGPTSWATPPAFFCDVFFWDRVWQTICPRCLRTTILLISASYVTRFAGVSHQCPASFAVFIYFILWWYWGLNHGLVLCRQALYHLCHSPSPFCFNYFPVSFRVFAWGWSWVAGTLLYTSWVAGMAGMHQCIITLAFLLRWCLTSFCLYWL
jgi:hypothetical protein